MILQVFARKSRLRRRGQWQRGGFFLFLLIIPLGGLQAQTAAEMDAMLEARTVSFARASRFVLAAADVADERPEAAYALALEKGWLPKKAAPDSPVRLGELCFLIMKAFNIEGSFLYALFPGPRYAFRELDYLKLIPGRRDPSLLVSGERVLQILEMALHYTGEPSPAAPEPPKPEQSAGTAALAEREQIAEVIRGELEQLEVQDTSVRVVETGVAISLNNIQFAPDSVNLIERERAKLREIAFILARYPEREILVGGHTAMAGTAEGRLQISKSRAQAVADFLVSLGSRRKESVIVHGYGAEQPLGDNATEEGQAINRRVEIIILDRRGQ
jgi:outer membrane protein OmpA-like peptidoglycan-associated protein